ncbi:MULTISPECIES: DUF1178 family protein [unclassified Caballeronia]|uniref:DUF1178 family protein n=1 Tax=unclassified Caballeronia TaxID=2646786 RepID=UPI0028599953|nr:MULTISPECIES: DUF1178 family protein [unclassified Caballeronia]MDR5750977.1 DUF1178 family protein [Caballeronia sp. LZ024]MDR5844888.1 DUF1178 family protein [Caballeronia sp. LZ031]
MKVLDLKCSHEHRFEGWFASTEAFESQLSRGLVACPVCSTVEVSRMPSAPRLNLSSSRNDSAPSQPQAKGAEPDANVIQARALRFLREVLEKSENVGERFAEEARRMHYNEAPARNIRGVATPEDAHALLEEGIDVMPLPIPAALKEPLQ